MGPANITIAKDHWSGITLLAQNIEMEIKVMLLWFTGHHEK